MANLLLECETEQSIEARTVHVGEQAIPFERFLDMAEGRFVELIRGVVVEKPMIQLDHEQCSRWLYSIAWLYALELGLGEMLSSRIMVKTDTFGGRMPDLLFVKRENLAIVQQKAVRGAPDLVIEIASPSDRPSHLQELEADYFGLSVPELVFIHLRDQEIHLLRRQDTGYAKTVITQGPVTFEALPGLTLQAEWILREPRPNVRATLNALFPS